MTDLLRDVDEMMRQERLKALWGTYGNYIIGGLLALILVVAGQQGYAFWSTKQAEKTAAAISTALLDKDPAAALSSYAAQTKGNARAAAALLALQKKGETGNTAQTLLTVFNDRGADHTLRDLAGLSWARMVADTPDVATNDIRSVLTKIIARPGSPYAAVARLDLAALIAHREHEFKTARDMLAPVLQDRNIPETLRERAAAMDMLYTQSTTKK